MDGHRFDAVVRGFGGATSRRQVLSRLLSGAAGGALSMVGLERAIAQDDDDDDDDNRNNGNNRQARQCRAEGDPCEGNQQCCKGLVCAQTGQGTAMRCTANAAECEDDCPPAENDAVVVQAQGAICRNEGESCGGDQLCCEGMLCGPSGKDQANRCVSENEPVETCEETCEPTEVRLQKPRAYKVEADCQYNEDDDRTTCDCKASSGDSGAPKVRRVTLPQSDICAEVIEGDYEVRNTSRNTSRETTNTASAGTGGEANASADGGAVVVGDVEGNTDVNVDASGGNAQADASGGDNNVAIAGGRGVRYESRVDRDTLQLTFAGRVEASGTATYWCETDEGVIPASGPALARVRDENAADAGAIVVRTAACDIDREQEGFDWFGQCRRPTKARLRLRAREGNDFVEKETVATDSSGRRGFRNLVAGTYRIAPEGAGWCHAECDSIDEQGDIVLEAGQQTTVWLFNCTKGR